MIFIPALLFIALQITVGAIYDKQAKGTHLIQQVDNRERPGIKF